MKNVEKIYLSMLSVSVFRSIPEHPLIKSFDKMMNASSERERIRSYSEFVGEIYKGGTSLADLIYRLICEDENVYVKKIASGKTPDSCVSEAVKSELYALSSLASLTPCDIKSYLGINIGADYVTGEVDFYSAYIERVKGIDCYGYGVFSSHPMFRLDDSGKLIPIVSADSVDMSMFIGYEAEREKVIKNTEAFICGKPAANVLLCGDAGTGKSSTVKAIVNSFFDRGIRLIELRKDQLKSLPYVMGQISGNPLRFIIFIDDLSFSQNDDSFSMLKAALEGSASAKAENAVIYATSNRRHIIKESFGDREGDDVHRNDTVQELLSLSERFGLVVLFSKPDKKLYLRIVHSLAQRCGISVDGDLDIKAEEFALRKGNRSARCAEQFINSLI